MHTWFVLDASISTLWRKSRLLQWLRSPFPRNMSWLKLHFLFRHWKHGRDNKMNICIKKIRIHYLESKHCWSYSFLLFSFRFDVKAGAITSDFRYLFVNVNWLLSLSTLERHVDYRTQTPHSRNIKNTYSPRLFDWRLSTIKFCEMSMLPLR